MRKAIAAMIAAAACVASTNAHAQLGAIIGKRIGMPALGEVGGAYQKNNQIRTYITTEPYPRIDLYAKAITKAAEMTKDKGFPMFGVTKSVCSTMLMNNIPRASSCYVIAIMLKEGEQARPRGKLKVIYYKVEDVLAGMIARPGH